MPLIVRGGRMNNFKKYYLRASSHLKFGASKQFTFLVYSFGLRMMNWSFCNNCNVEIIINVVIRNKLVLNVNFSVVNLQL